MSSPSAQVIEELARTARRETEEAQAAHRSYLAGFAGGPGGAGPESVEDESDALEAARAALADRSGPAERRTTIVSRLGTSILRLPTGIDTLLQIAADRDDDAAVRRAAVGLLHVAAFEVVRFEPYRTAYVDVLRGLIDDPDAELRDTAVTSLATEHDDVAQQALTDGLEGKRALPVERNRAIELLAEDDHLDTLPWLRELYAGGSEGDRATAARFMGVHPAAEDDVTDILRDRTETSAVRQHGAAALRNLAPGRFDTVAKSIVLDTDDDPDVRALCLQNLRVAGGGAGVYDDPDFLDGIRAVSAEPVTTDVTRLAQRTLDDAPGS